MLSAECPRALRAVTPVEDSIKGRSVFIYFMVYKIDMQSMFVYFHGVCLHHGSYHKLRGLTISGPDECEVLGVLVDKTVDDVYLLQRSPHRICLHRCTRHMRYPELCTGREKREVNPLK